MFTQTGSPARVRSSGRRTVSSSSLRAAPAVSTPWWIVTVIFAPRRSTPLPPVCGCPTALPIVTVVSGLPRSVGFGATTTYSSNSLIRRSPLWSTTSYPRIAVTAGSTWSSVRTGGSTCRWGCPATYATRTMRSTAPSWQWRPTVVMWKSTPRAYGIPSASTGTRKPAISGSPTTAAIGWGIIARRMSSTTLRSPASTSAFPTCTEPTFRTRITGLSGPRASRSGGRYRSWVRTWRL